MIMYFGVRFIFSLKLDFECVERECFSPTGAGVHGAPLHALAEGEGGHVGVGVHALLHVATPHAL